MSFPPLPSGFRLGPKPPPETINYNSFVNGTQQNPANPQNLEPNRTQQLQTFGSSGLYSIAGRTQQSVATPQSLEPANIIEQLQGLSISSTHSIPGVTQQGPATSLNLEPKRTQQLQTFGSSSLYSSASSPSFGSFRLKKKQKKSFGLYRFKKKQKKSFGLAGNTGFYFGSFAKHFSSGTTFGLTSSSEAGTISSGSSTTSSLFGSNWQAPKSPIFVPTSNSTSPSTGFRFGASSASVAATSSASMAFGSSTGASLGSIFSLNSAPAAASSQPVFSNSNTGFTFGANPFHFGSQQNLLTPQNQSPFQASAISLGTGGGDKSNMKIVKVKHKQRKK